MRVEDIRVLLVEDDPLMRTFASNTLKRIGVKHIQECENGAQGLETAVMFEPNLILTDIHMKPVNGLEFIKKLRELPDAKLQKTKVIFMSADASQQTLKSAVPLGLLGYIVKPPKLEYLKAKIDTMLSAQ